MKVSPTNSTNRRRKLYVLMDSTWLHCGSSRAYYSNSRHYMIIGYQTKRLIALQIILNMCNIFSFEVTYYKEMCLKNYERSSKSMEAHDVILKNTLELIENYDYYLQTVVTNDNFWTKSVLKWKFFEISAKARKE